MKRRILWALLLCLALTACRPTGGESEKMVQPFSFYYLSTEVDHSSADGLITPELRDLGSTGYSEEALFRLYLEGPQTEGLLSPLPKGAELLGASRSGGVLELRILQNYDTLSAIDSSLAAACLARTAFGLEGVRAVRVRVESKDGEVLRSTTLTAQELLLYDDGEQATGTEVTLYFADTAGRFLLTEKRTLPSMDEAALPQYVLEQLLAGPQSPGMVSALPEGTALLDVNVENRTCAVDFNADFYNNRPRDERGEQLALLSVANTLCELRSIDQVQFYVEGRRRETYFCLSLLEPYTADGSAVGPVREELSELDAVLYLPAQTGLTLHALPVRLRLRGGLTTPEAVLQALIARPSQNGLANPLAESDIPTLTLENGTCTVRYAARQKWQEDDLECLRALRSVTATLCALNEVQRVQIVVESTVLNGENYTPAEDWFYN